MFESGSRVQDTLADLAAIMGDRNAAICREMTKLHEDIRRAPISELAQAAETLETRGEFVLVIAPPADKAAMEEDEVDQLLRERLAHDSVKDAVAHAVELSGRPRREIYARALELTKERNKERDAEGSDGE
jgi:16S rRNA (cytidine1402-2'-O)-methyltransferase